MTLPRRPLGEVLTLDLDQVQVDALQEYSIAGVYGFGRGVFRRGPIVGADTSYQKLNRLHAGELVLSRLKAFEGAVAVVPAATDGWFLSPEFPTFRCAKDELEAQYLAYVCRWPEFWYMLASTSKGIGARRERVHPEALLGLELRLPPIDEQLRVAALLDWMSRSAHAAADRLAGVGDDTIVALLPGLIDSLIDRHARGTSRVSELADFVSDTVHPGDDPAPAEDFIGLQHVESHTGRRLGADAIEGMKGRKFRFRPGDVLYGYLRPYLNKVRVADRHGLCSVDQYVLRPRFGVSAEILAYTLRGQRSLRRAIDLTHSLQLPRLRSGLVGALEVATAVESEQQTLLARLHSTSERIVAAAARRRQQNEVVAALVPAALNEAFVGLR